jgi:glucosamine-6-phosphate deaminase
MASKNEEFLMPRKLSAVAPEWWDYTTLAPEIVEEAAGLTPEAMVKLSRPGFQVVLYDTLEDFYLAEALEYIEAWKQSTPDNPVGVCGPIGPTEQLPLVARLVNSLGLDVRSGHFWGMDEWAIDGQAVDVTHPLSFERCDRALCFDCIAANLRMPDANLHFPKTDLQPYWQSWEAGVRCAVMQGGQGDVKHWAFNDPFRRTGEWADNPPPPEVFRRLKTRLVNLHPLTIAQNARTSGGGNISLQCGALRDLEGRQGVDLARRDARQPVRAAVDLLDDREESARLRGAHVAPRRPSQRAVQLLPRGDRFVRGRDALELASETKPARIPSPILWAKGSPSWYF